MVSQSETIVAIYENGILRPQHSVPFNEGETVRLQVLKEISSHEAEQKASLELALPSPQRQVNPVKQLQRERERKLVEVKGKPLSEMIIEDRD